MVTARLQDLVYDHIDTVIRQLPYLFLAIRIGGAAKYSIAGEANKIRFDPDAMEPNIDCDLVRYCT